MTSRTLKTSAGCKVTVKNRRGLDEGTIAAALEEALGQVRGRGEAAA